MSQTKDRPTLRPVQQQKTPAPAPAKPHETGNKASGNILVDLGFEELINLNGGYIPSRPELDLTDKARGAIKRLSLTLDQREERLSDGSIVGTSVSRCIVWLCERFADSVS